MLSVALQVVVPGEQVFSEGVEVERVALLLIFRVLTEVFKLRRQACFAHAVVGVEQDTFFVLQVITKVLRNYQ